MFGKASVQYDDFVGSLAGDRADFQSIEEYLAIDKAKWRLIGLSFYSGEIHQALTPYVIDATTSYEDLVEAARVGNRIRLVELDSIDSLPSDYVDSRPATHSGAVPVDPISVLLRSFKRLNIMLHTRHLPENLEFVTLHVSEL